MTDALCEAFHEHVGGNPSAVTGIMRCVSGFWEARSGLLQDLAPFLKRADDSPFLNIDQMVVRKHYLPRISLSNYPNQHHTPESIKNLKTDFPVYNAWKALIIQDFGQEGMDWLTKGTEVVRPVLSLVS